MIRRATILSALVTLLAPSVGRAQEPSEEIYQKPEGDRIEEEPPAAEPAPAGPIIESIQFEGLRRVDADAVRIVMTTRRGRPFDPKAISDDIRAIYGTGYFDDVQVYQERTDKGVALFVVLVEKPSIRRVDIVGNDDISNDDVKDVVDLRPFTIYNEAKVKKNVQKIKELYVGKGYYLADVTSKIEKLPGGEVVVIFEIDENAKVQVRSLRFTGNEHLDSDLLKTGLATQEGSLLSFLTDAGTYRAEAFQVDLLRISSHYFDRGYINVKVEPPDIEISPDRKFLYITIRIEEGEQYSIGKIDFSGDFLGEDKEKAKQELFDLVKSEEGQIFNRSQLGTDLLALKTRYEDEGYAYANITPLTNIDSDKRIIDMTFDIQKGEKVYYERINIVGNSKTRDKVIRRELRIYEGELTSASLRELSRRRVQALGYFEKVELKTRKGSNDALQIVDVEVKERATGTFQVGAGLSSAENFIITAQISQENFLGRGQSVALSMQISGLQQLFQLRFNEPYFFDTEWTFGFDAYNTETSFRSFLRSSSGGDITFGHPITDDIRFYLTYRLEFVQSRGDAGLTGQPAFAALNNKGRISSVQGRIDYDTRDNRLFPSDGMYHFFSVEVSDDVLGASESRQFQKYRLVSRYYHPILWGFVGKLSARFGYINSTSPQGLAPSEKFILGGITTLRGYVPFSIGPERVATTNLRGTELYDPFARTFEFIEGGNKEFLFNAEIEFPIFEEVGIKGVIFLDAGNAYSESENFFYLGNDPEDTIAQGPFDPGTLPLGLFWSVGFGFRWFSPIGPLRFEWGIPLTPRPLDDRGPLFEFTIGNAF
jgi:outer membrane protein insertion porin family